MEPERTEQAALDPEEVFEPEVYSGFYDDVPGREGAEKEVEFLTHVMELHRPARILDLGCGSGRHANLLARRGYDVTGIDITHGFLQIARAGASKLDVNVRYVLQDMREISFSCEYDAVLLMSTTFGYFSDEENMKVLSHIARALKPGGLFCFDIPHRDFMEKSFPPSSVKPKESELNIDRHVCDHHHGRPFSQKSVFRHGKRHEKPFYVRLYNAAEIRDILKMAGIELVRLYGDWDMQPLSDKSPKIIVIGKKEE